MFYRKKKKKALLINSFGQLKEDSFDFSFIQDYFRKKQNPQVLQILSDKTCNDLDFDELFMFLDRTHSKIGQQFLYNKLRTIPVSSDKNVKLESIINKFLTDPEFRVNIQQQLEKLNSIQTFYVNTLFQDEHLKKPKWFFIVPLLSVICLLSIIFAFVYNVMLFVIAVIFIVNMGIYYWNKSNLYIYLGSIPQLLRLNVVARNFLKHDIFQDIDLNISESIKSIDKVRNRMTSFKLQLQLETPAEMVFGFIFEVFKILFLVEPIMLFEAISQLDSRRKEIEAVFSFVGEIDCCISVASLRTSLTEYCYPFINTEKTISFQNMVHPLIYECIPNDLHVDKKSILLTGSNMSGKTSFIRAIGINIITGLTINTCFAKSFSFPRLKIYSAIRINDDLMNDKSYYFEEVLTIKEMIDEGKKGIMNLFLLDEIFKGTNTVERISAGKAVLSYLKNLDNIVFVSTHDIELADLLKKEYELFHFSELVNNKTVDFDFKLKPGKLKLRNAIRILQINGYPDSIISEATEISNYFDLVKSV